MCLSRVHTHTHEGDESRINLKLPRPLPLKNVPCPGQKHFNRSIGDLPWTVDCSLHPWLQGRRPFVGTVLAIASDRLSFTLSRPVEPSSGDALITPTSSDNVAGITAGGQRVKAEGVCDEQDNPRWIGVPLDGVWEVVEGASSGGGGPPDALPEGFLRGSGAALVTGKYVSEEQGGGARGDEAFVRAKL